MVFFQLRVRCLAHQREWKKEYENINELKNDIFDQFQSFDINEQSGIIVYYNEQDQCDHIFDTLDILPTDGTTIFDLYVKRVCRLFRMNYPIRRTFLTNRFGLVVEYVSIHLISFLIVFH